MKRFIYAGSFDPITNGHMDIIQKSKRYCDELIILVAENLTKKGLFEIQQRVVLIQEALKEAQMLNVTVTSYQGATADAFEDFKAVALVRGVRGASEWESEYNLSLMNKGINPRCDTIFIPADPNLMHISSSYIKELMSLKKDYQSYVPSCVVEALRV